jgi:hypothetical protein
MAPDLTIFPPPPEPGPPNSFLLWANGGAREAFLAENPGKSSIQISQLLGLAWKKMTEAEKAQWKHAADLEMTKWKAAHPDEGYRMGGRPKFGAGRTKRGRQRRGRRISINKA